MKKVGWSLEARAETPEPRQPCQSEPTQSVVAHLHGVDLPTAAAPPYRLISSAQCCAGRHARFPRFLLVLISHSLINLSPVRPSYQPVSHIIKPVHPRPLLRDLRNCNYHRPFAILDLETNTRELLPSPFNSSSSHSLCPTSTLAPRHAAAKARPGRAGGHAISSCVCPVCPEVKRRDSRPLAIRNDHCPFVRSMIDHGS